MTSPLPWKVEPLVMGSSIVRDADGGQVAVVTNEDAALIVRAVNNHAALLGVCLAIQSQEVPTDATWRELDAVILNAGGALK